MKRIVALAIAVTLLGAAGPNPTAMRFGGHWEVVRGRNDGRFDGASARSFHAGDTLELSVKGTGFRIFGVTGPTGGHAVVLVGNQPDRTIDFYSAVKHVHVLLYTSPTFRFGPHEAAVVVVPERDKRSRGNYVNIDTVEVLR